MNFEPVLFVFPAFVTPAGEELDFFFMGDLGWGSLDDGANFVGERTGKGAGEGSNKGVNDPPDSSGGISSSSNDVEEADAGEACFLIPL